MRLIRWLGILGVVLPGTLSAGPVQTGSISSGEISTARQADSVGEVEALKKPESSSPLTPVAEPWGQLAQAEQAASSRVEATAVVAKLNQTLLEVMRRAKELEYAGRYRLLEPVVKRVYDFGSISRYVLGPHWKQLSAEEKKVFIQKMTEFGIAAYAAHTAPPANETPTSTHRRFHPHWQARDVPPPKWKIISTAKMPNQCPVSTSPVKRQRWRAIPAEIHAAGKVKSVHSPSRVPVLPAPPCRRLLPQTKTGCPYVPLKCLLSVKPSPTLARAQCCRHTAPQTDHSNHACSKIHSVSAVGGYG